VHIRVARFVWDCQMLPNPPALAIYLKLVHISENQLKCSINVNMKMTIFVSDENEYLLGYGLIGVLFLSSYPS
jgi:hypothetical protein